jgi:hypothetical protein
VNKEEKIKIPRLVSRSKNRRINVDTKISEDYFRIATAIPFYDNFIINLNDFIVIVFINKKKSV